MLNQNYQDLTFVFGAPSGNRYEMLKKISDETHNPFSEIFYEYLEDIFKKTAEGGLLDQTFSSALGKDIEIGDKLADGSLVTGCIKFSAKEQKIYKTKKWVQPRDPFLGIPSFNLKQ